MDIVFYVFICGCMLAMIVSAALTVTVSRADRRIAEMFAAHVAERWWCLGPCESYHSGPCPADQLCPACRQWLEEARVPA